MSAHFQSILITRLCQKVKRFFRVDDELAPPSLNVESKEGGTAEFLTYTFKRGRRKGDKLKMVELPRHDPKVDIM